MDTRSMYRSERIKALREQAHLTQAALAQRTGTTQPTVSRIEKGEIKERPDRALAVRMASVFGVRLGEVYDDEAAEPAEPDNVGLESDDTGVSLFESAALSVVDPALHSLADLTVAADAWRQAERAGGRTANPAEHARAWLDTARAMRLEGSVSASALIARMAMRRSA